VDPDLAAALAVVRGLCKLLGDPAAAAEPRSRGRYDPDDFDADELGLDPEEDFDA